MIKYANKADVAHCTEIVTNASLLTPKMADSLIDAELGLLRVSLQGVTDEMYDKIGGTDFPVQDIISNLKYFYDNRNNTRIMIKIINIGLNNDKEKKLFFELLFKIFRYLIFLIFLKGCIRQIFSATGVLQR